MIKAVLYSGSTNCRENYLTLKCSGMRLVIFLYQTDQQTDVSRTSGLGHRQPDQCVRDDRLLTEV